VPERPAPTARRAALPSGEKPPLFRHPGRVAIVGGTLFVIAVLIAISIGSADTSSLKTDEPQPKEVQSFSPAQNAIVPPNTSISVDLRDDLIGELRVCAPTPENCTPIPLDQTDTVLSLGQVTFKPTDKTDITEFPTGPVTVHVDYHLQGSTAADAGSFAWSFTVKA
jgi:hypothetical protein